MDKTLHGSGQNMASAADLKLAHALADRADAVTLDRFQSDDLKVATKADLSPVTDADRSTEAAIRKLLATHRPDDSIFGEEMGVTGSSTRQWVIDPIDGTKNFLRGVPVWATLIALAQDGEVTVGVVSAPALGRRWWAGKGLGAYVGVQQALRESSNCCGTNDCCADTPVSDAFDYVSTGQRIHVSAIDRFEDASLSYSSLSGWKARGRLDHFLDLTDRMWRTRAYGDFWSYMMVAEGVCDIAAEPELETYDMAALVPIVTEAGGRFTSLLGDNGPWGGTGVATNGLLHDEVLQILAWEEGL